MTGQNGGQRRLTEMTNLRLLLCGFALLIAYSLNAGQQPTQRGQAILFEGARLIMGDTRAPVENSAFVVEAGRITRIGQKGKIPLPPASNRVDLTGKTVMPAMVNLHGHVGYQKGLSYAAENYTRDN